MNKLAEITMNKSGKIAQLQMKCEVRKPAKKLATEIFNFIK